MGLFDRLFGKKKDTKEQSEEQEIAQVLEETSADESKEVAETAAVETQAEDVIESEVTPVSEEARQLDETKEAAEADFLGVMADYYAKKEAAKEALDRGETVEFEAVETKQEDVKEESVEPVNAPVETEEEKYNRSLKKTRTGFSARLNAFLANFRRVDEDFFEELEEMLILSDVGVNVATQLTEDLRYEAKLENAKKADDLKRVIIEKLVEIYEKDGVFNEQINFQDGLTVMLFVGVNGVGKTTSIGKLAYKYKNEGKKVMLVAADTFRAGAVAQLAECPSCDGTRKSRPSFSGL